MTHTTETMSNAEKIARNFSCRPSDQNWCWLYLILSGRSLRRPRNPHSGETIMAETTPNVEKIAAGLSSEESHILRHSLGVPDHGKSEMYRNHFVTGEGSVDYPHCMALVSKGLMWRRDGNPLTGGDDLFGVTDAGKAAVREILRREA